MAEPAGFRVAKVTADPVEVRCVIHTMRIVVDIRWQQFEVMSFPLYSIDVYIVNVFIYIQQVISCWSGFVHPVQPDRSGDLEGEGITLDYGYSRSHITNRLLAYVRCRGESHWSKAYHQKWWGKIGARSFPGRTAYSVFSNILDMIYLNPYFIYMFSICSILQSMWRHSHCIK